MVDEEHVVLTHQRPAVVALHGHQFVRFAGRRPHAVRIRKDLDPVLRAPGVLPVHKDSGGFVLGDRESGIGQQGRHAELGVARQHRKGRFQLRGVAVLLAYQAQKFVRNLEPQGVRHDHAHLVLLPQKGTHPLLEELLLGVEGKGFPPGRRLHKTLEGIPELQQVAV